MAIKFLDPTHETSTTEAVRAGRLGALAGARIAIISNGKKNTKPFFDAMAAHLKTEFKVAEVVRITKSNYSAPVEPELLAEAEKWQAIISGIGD